MVDDTNTPRFTDDAWLRVMNKSATPPDQQYRNIDPYKRIDCGYLGIGQFDREGTVYINVTHKNY